MFNTDFIFLEEVSSTISYAKNYLKDNYLDNNKVIIANTQSKGIGKTTNMWISPKGNLYLTAIFNPFINYKWNNSRDINIFNLLMSLSLLQSINIILDSKKYTIFTKWPNDIILNEKKVSGILLENISYRNNNIILASVGINIKVAPADINNGYGSIALNDITDKLIKPKSFADILINQIYKNVQLKKEIIIQNWLKYAYKLNQSIIVKIKEQKKQGIFKGINKEGFLVLEVDNKKLETISVGEVY